jgi:hypothetical protein
MSTGMGKKKFSPQRHEGHKEDKEKALTHTLGAPAGVKDTKKKRSK